MSLLLRFRGAYKTMQSLRNHVLSWIRKFTESPALNFCVGAIFLISGLIEAWDTLFEDLRSANIGAHHGAIIFGFVHALKYVPDLFEGTEYVERSLDK